MVCLAEHQEDYLFKHSVKASYDESIDIKEKLYCLINFDFLTNCDASGCSFVVLIEKTLSWFVSSLEQ